MDIELAYQAFLIKLPTLDEEGLYYYIQNSLERIEKEKLFSLCFQCKKVNPQLFPIFFISLTRMFPLSSLKTYIHNISLLEDFTWSDYINILTVLCDRNLVTDEINIYNKMFTTIINIIVERLYSEKYLDTTISTLGIDLPRERKKLDKKIKIVKKLAHTYYKLYLKKNKLEDDWEDVDNDFNIKNKALQLYRKDVKDLSDKAKLHTRNY